MYNLYSSFILAIFVDFGVVREEKELTFPDRISLHQARWCAFSRHDLILASQIIYQILLPFFCHVKKLKYKFIQLAVKS